MANSALHAITLEKIRVVNPTFHQEYCLLIEGISNLIRDLVKKHKSHRPFSSFTETYDRDKVEPVLQIVICTAKEYFHLHIYINKQHQFVIGESVDINAVNNSSEALALLQNEVKKSGWL